MKRAIFLDRDGTIIEDRGHLSRPGEVVLFDFTVSSLLALAGTYEFFVVSNQTGVSRGLITMEDVERVNRHLDGLLSRAGVRINRYYVCPHTPEERCACRKPSPYFLHEAAGEFGLDLSMSWVIGDHPPDVELALNAGARGIYVLTGHGEKHRAEVPAGTLVLPSLKEAAEYILAEDRSG